TRMGGRKISTTAVRTASGTTSMRRSSSSWRCFGPSTIIADPVAITANRNCQLHSRMPSIAYSVARNRTKYAATTPERGHDLLREQVVPKDDGRDDVHGSTEGGVAVHGVDPAAVTRRTPCRAISRQCP